MRPKSGAAFLTSATLGYDNANQRTRATQENDGCWICNYNSLGQVQNGKKYWKDGSVARTILFVSFCLTGFESFAWSCRGKFLK